MRLALIVLLSLGTPVAAAEVGLCGDLNSVSFLVGQTKSYSEGKIRIAEIDTDGEPVCCSSHLLILIPNPEIGSQCFAVSDRAATGASSARGFSAVDFDKITASYDPAKGLLLKVPYRLYDAGRKSPTKTTNVRVNLKGQGSVRIEP